MTNHPNRSRRSRMLHRPAMATGGERQRHKSMPLDASVRFVPGYYNPYTNYGYGPCWRIFGPPVGHPHTDTTAYPSLAAAIDQLDRLSADLDIVYRIEAAPELTRYRYVLSPIESVERELARDNLASAAVAAHLQRVRNRLNRVAAP